ncbi:MAG: tetratricopeptide repeat protein [Candidatus Omnitrophica bacterium]|nr:tetratricopeptide repeat protein [Candidatus Omnitrophota bacterium]
MNPKNIKNTPAKPAPVKKPIILASIALIIILGIAVYANSLNGKFVYDDHILVKDNALIREWPISLKLFTTGFGISGYMKSSFYRPLQMITYAMNYHSWKLSVIGYHLTSILLHILVALCIYWLIDILFNDKTLSFLTAIFFVVHPLHTGVVNYISSRADPMYLFFMLISLIFYIKSSRANNAIHYIIMASSYLLALLSKENSLILPALILLYHYTFKEKIRLKEFLSISGITFIYILLRVTVLKYLMTGSISNSTLLQRIPGFFAAITDYIKLPFLPIGLHMEYGAPIFSFIDPKVICGIAILITLIFLAVKTVKTNRLTSFSILWFLVTLIPVSNLYPINAYMAENWLYLPSIGFFLILSRFLIEAYRKERYRILTITLAVLLLAFYSYLTIIQNDTWREPVPFYERILKYAPGSPKVYNNLASIYDEAGRKEEAIAMYKKAIEINPNYAEAYSNLANRYNEAGRKEEAIAMYKKAIEINPNYAPAYSNLANRYNETGRKEEAIAMYEKSIEINPNFAPAYINLGVAYHGIGREEEATAMYKKAIEINPNYAEAYNNLGNAYFGMGKVGEAIAMYKRALEINPAHTNARLNLGVINSKSK